MNKKKLSALLSFIFFISFLQNPVLAQQTDPLALSNIVVNNNYNMPDSVTITGSGITLEPDDVIKIYASSTAITPITQNIITTTCSGIDIPIDTSGTTLTNKGDLYVTFTKDGQDESAKVDVPYDSQQTAPLAASNIVVSNKYGVPDVVTVTGSGVTLEAGDVISIYTTSTSTTPITTTITSNCSGIDIPIDTNGETLTSKGTLYVTLTKSEKQESKKVAASYISEQTVGPASNQAAVVNNYGANDVITLTGGAKAGSTINIYAADSTGKKIDTTNVLATTVAAVDVSGSKPVVITGIQVGETAGNIYVTVQENNKSTSAAIRFPFKIEPKTITKYLQKLKNNIIVTNNRIGLNDTVEIKGGLQDGDMVAVYTKSGSTYTQIASTTDSAVQAATTVAAVGVKSTATTVNTLNPPEPTTSGAINTTSQGIKFNLPVDALDENKSGSIYITIKNVNALESDKMSFSYKNADSASLAANKITVFNDDVDNGDIIRIRSLLPGDTVYVFDALDDSGKKVAVPTTTTGAIQYATVQDGETSVNIKNFNLPLMKFKNSKYLTKGTIYMSVARNGMKMSKVISIDFIPQQ